MYCPNCNQEFEGKFCPECGAKLIEKPSAGVLNINLGDANAISGGINLHDSHNVTNVDNSVHNITNITEVRSDIEIRQQLRTQYFKACESMLSDGILSLDELRELETLRIHLNISKDEADRILDLVKAETVKRPKTTDLDLITKIKIQKFTKMISSNDLEGLKTQIDAMVALAATNNNEDLHYYCYSVLSTIDPGKMVEILISSVVDDYWESFWSYVAYLKIRDYGAAEKLFVDMSRFKDYPESNLALLGCIGELLKGDEDSAHTYYEVLSDDCSIQLRSIYSCVRCIFERDLSLESQKNFDFYLVHLFERSISTYAEAIPFVYDAAFCFSEGLGPVEKNGKWGYVDKTGREVIPCQYEDAFSFKEGLGLVKKNGKMGYVDKTGQEVISCQYDACGAFCEGLAWVLKNGKSGYIDKAGREVVPCQYESASDFSEGLGLVEKNGKSGYVDKTGREVVPCQYDGGDSFCEDFAIVLKNGKMGYVDKTGREVIHCQYDACGAFSEGLANVLKNGKQGYVDKTGREVIPCQYESAFAFSEGLAAVSKNYKMRYIDKTGREVIYCSNMCYSFLGGLGRIRKKGKWGYIDKTGQEVVPCLYDPDEKFICFSEECVLAIDCNGDTYIYRTNGQKKKALYNYTEIIHGFKEGLACVKRDGKLGFIDKTGREVISCRFDEDGADCFNEGYAVVKLNGKWGYLRNTEYKAELEAIRKAEEETQRKAAEEEASRKETEAKAEEEIRHEVAAEEKTDINMGLKSVEENKQQDVQDQECSAIVNTDTPETIVDGIIDNMVGGFENVNIFSKNDKYKVCKYLVTQHEWEIIMGSNPSFEKSPNYPVVDITYQEAEDFVRRVNTIASKKGYEFMIPKSDWQWLGYQKKCAEAFKHLDKPILKAGVSAFVWHELSSGGHLHDVGKLKSTCGIYDACGLVYEMCQTKKYNSYHYGAFNKSIDHCFGNKSSELMYVDLRYDNLGLRLICLE